MFYDPLNPLPPKCKACGFPDLDYIPQPYFLIKSRTLSPDELAPAQNGNLFVRDRVRRILELVAPGQCDFFPTCNKGTAEVTPWLLAVPRSQVATAKVNPDIPRCTVCGEPRSAHPGTQYSEHLWNGDSEQEVLKSATWGSSNISWQEWIDRDLFISVRLLTLFKQAGAKGLVQATCGKPTAADKAELDWVRQKMELLRQHGIALHAAGNLSDEDAKWLRQYCSQHAASQPLAYDIKSIEKRLKFKLPKSYIDFITKVGPVSFENVDEQDGFSVQVLAADNLMFKIIALAYSARMMKKPMRLMASCSRAPDMGIVYASMCAKIAKSSRSFCISTSTTISSHTPRTLPLASSV